MTLALSLYVDSDRTAIVPRYIKADFKKKKKTKESAATSGVTEFAGNASAVPDLANPSSPIQPHADFRWNADSGCTSTMTPHRHWIQNYHPLCVGVELADGSIIYSAGVGTVVIDPVVDGKRI